MAWYDDKSRKSYVATYKDENAMRRDVEQASKRGWVVQDTSGVSGHINVGRTASRVVLTGGLGLLFGASRSKDKITITYLRDEAWLAESNLADAQALAEKSQSKLARAEAEIQKHSTSFNTLFDQSIAISGARPEGIEKDLARALKELAQARISAVKAGEEAIATSSRLAGAFSQASAAGVQVARPVKLESDLVRLRDRLASEQRNVAHEESLRQIQDLVVSDAKQWREASEKQANAMRHSEAAANATAQARAAVEGAPPDSASKLDKKLQEAQADEAKRKSELETRDAELAERASVLQARLLERNAATADALSKDDIVVNHEPASIPAAADEAVSAGEETRESGQADIPAQIQKLADLHRAGILTDEEFANKKAELLARM